MWVKRISLSDPARSVVTHIRSSQPTRRVGSRRGNVVRRYPSMKMGVTIQFESHRVELPAILEPERNDDVLEYYDQPPTIKLDYFSAGGKHLGVLHTPDFFVVRAVRAGHRPQYVLSSKSRPGHCSRCQSWGACTKSALRSKT